MQYTKECQHGGTPQKENLSKTKAGLHDNVPADLLPRWQKVRQFRATQPRYTDVPDWVTTSAVKPTFWDNDSFTSKCHGRQLAPNRCNLGGRSVWDVVVQPSPDRKPGQDGPGGVQGQSPTGGVQVGENPQPKTNANVAIFKMFLKMTFLLGTHPNLCACYRSHI